MSTASPPGMSRRSAACAWILCALAIACYEPRRPRLIFATEPGPAIAGEVLETVTVVARDEAGHPYAGYVGPVHLRIEGAAAMLCGGDVPSLVGAAEFSSLVIDRPAVAVRLVAEAAEASPARSAPFDVGAPVPLPQVVAFACEPAQVPIGATGTLSWSVGGTTAAEILPIGAVPASGSTVLAPYADGGMRATYELRAPVAGDPPLRVVESGRTRGGGAGTDVLTAIDAFPDGSAIAVGTFEDPAQFGGPLRAQTPSSSLGSGAFVARLRADGGVAWSRALTGAPAPNPGDTPAAVAAGADGGVLLIESGTDYVVVGSLDADGGAIWERRSETVPPRDHEARARGIAALPGGGAAVSATAGGALRLAADGPDALLLENGDAGFGVLAVHGADGRLEWGRKSGRSLRAIAAESTGGLYALGTYGPEAAPGGATEPGCAGPASGSFLGRYAADGGISWVQCLPENLKLASLAVDRDDAAIAAGSATGSFVIPPGTIPVDAGGPSIRAIVVRWDASGLQSSAMLLPDRGRGPPYEAWAVAPLPDGSILVTAGIPGKEDRGLLARYDRAGSVLALTEFPSAIRAAGLSALPGGGFWIATSYRGAFGTCGSEQRSTPGKVPGVESIDALALRYDPVNFRLLEVRPP